MKNWQLWRHDGYSWVANSDERYRWKWWADFQAWHRQKAGWFRYRVARIGERPW